MFKFISLKKSKAVQSSLREKRQSEKRCPMLSSEWLCRVTDPGQVMGLENSVG